MLSSRLHTLLILGSAALLWLPGCPEDDPITDDDSAAGDDDDVTAGDDDDSSGDDDDTTAGDDDDSAGEDLDGDGFTAEEDCDDGDEFVHPDATEICDDGVDNDCDGHDSTSPGCPVTSLAAAGARLLGEAGSDQAGVSVSSAGDVNADGFADILVGANGESSAGLNAGAAYLLHGPQTGLISLAGAHAKVTGAAAGDGLGISVAPAGDVDGDGLDDWMCGADGHDAGGASAGAAYLFVDLVTGEVPAAQAASTLLGESEYDRAGMVLSRAGDQDGDGLEDLLVSTPYHDSDEENAGAVYRVPAPAAGTECVCTDSVRLFGSGQSHYAGWAMAGGEDVDGDGLADLLVGAFGVDVHGPFTGAAYLVLGPLVVSTGLAHSDSKLVGEEAGDFAGTAVALGDVDGDGLADLIVGAPGDSSGAFAAGAAYVITAVIADEVSLGTAEAKLLGEVPYDAAGSAVASAGDVNGDGYDDVLVGAPEADPAGENRGAAYLLLGPLSGAIDLIDAHVKLVGEGVDDAAGFALAPAGDTNGDGLDDFLVGAYGHDSVATDAGAAYLLLGGSL